MFFKLKKPKNISNLLFPLLIFVYFVGSWLLQYNQPSLDWIEETIIGGSWWQIAIMLVMIGGIFLQFPIILPIVVLITALNIISFDIAGQLLWWFILAFIILDIWYAYYFFKLLKTIPRYLKDRKFGIVASSLVIVTVGSGVAAIVLYRNEHVTKDVSSSPVVDERCVDKKDGLNEAHSSEGGIKSIFLCKSGQLEGVSIYKDGKIESEVSYINGVKQGVEIGYGDLGNVNYYQINHQAGGFTTIYDQGPEKAVYQSVVYRKADQTEICVKKQVSTGPDLIYRCVDNVFDGNYQDNSGPVVERARLSRGLLDGTFERKVKADVFDDFYHVEFKNGMLSGHIYHYDFGQLVYDGHYLNGLQEGIFKIYSLGGEKEAEIEFYQGKIKKIIYSKEMERVFGE